MKCIGKKSGVQKKSTVKGKARKKKIQKTLILVGILLASFLLGGLILVLLSRGNSLKEAVPYDRSRRIFGTSANEDMLTAKGLADALCVGSGDTSLSGVEPKEGELAGLFDIKEKKIPFSKGIYEQVSPGEITQLMTALVAYEKLDMEQTVTIEQEDVVSRRSMTSCGLSAGNVISARQLLNAVLVYSADDACLALARSCAQSQEAFVQLMNEKARELGMTNTSFANATGTSDENQYTTIYDIYLLLNAVLQKSDLINGMGVTGYTMNYSKANKDTKQQRLDSNNLYVTGRVSVPKGVTVLGGKMVTSDSENYTVLLVQNPYGDPFAAIILQASTQTDMYERMAQMLEKI